MTSIPPSVDQPGQDEPSPAPPPTATPAPTPRPELRRSGTNRLLGGVCGGLAEYSGIDALLWRVGFVGLTVAGGAGLVVYLLLWLFMPPPPPSPENRTNVLDDWVGKLHTKVSGRTDRPTSG